MDIERTVLGCITVKVKPETLQNNNLEKSVLFVDIVNIIIANSTYLKMRIS